MSEHDVPEGAFLPHATTAERYATFARVEARGSSPLYEELATGVSRDDDLLAFLETVPPPKRQPNLLFAAVLYLGGVQPDYAAFRRFALGNQEAVREILLTRSTQTNEVGRCATLLPLLASLPQPLALLEVGASGGLCLLPDRYRYSYDRASPIGDPGSSVILQCETRGPVPVPAALPQVVWRRGIDLAPIDVRDPAAVRWLECCVWPDQPERLARLRAAIAVAREDPPRLMAGDLIDELPAVAATAPRDATLVVFHSAVLAYLNPEQRTRFAELVATLPCTWISNEGAGAIPSLPREPGDRDDGRFVLGLNGREVVAYTGPHGQWIEWRRHLGGQK
jgi:hypothetical protein